MNGFYVSMISTGVFLIIVFLFFVIFDKSKTHSILKAFEDKKLELTEIINDAEQMIDELNRFSEYIVDQMELKNEELNRNLKDANQQINAISERFRKICVNIEPDVLEISAMPDHKAVAPFVANGAAVNTADTVIASYNGANACTYAKSARKNEKVIPFSRKYSEVIRLSQQGMECLDIAKTLNMGKGEVELIIGVTVQRFGASSYAAPVDFIAGTDT